MSVDLVNELARNRGGTVQNDREARQTLGNFLEYVETQRRRNEDALLVAGALLRGELVSAVGGADCDSQGVTAGAGYELLNLFRMGVGGILSRNLYVILNAGQSAELSLNDNTVSVSVLYDLLGLLNVLVERTGGAVDHNGGETAVDAGLAGLEVRAVVQMQGDRNIRALLNSCLYHLYEVGVVSVSACALGYLKNDRSVLLLASLGDTLNDLHVVHVESADSVAAVISLLEHLSSSN